MSYIGRGVDAISNVEKLDNITFNGGTTYALTKSSAAFTPSSSNAILISIDGVVQQGNFSVSTTNIVFDWSPTSSNTCDWVMHFGVGVLNTPADGSITAAKMAANSVDSDSYVDGSIDAVHLSANSVDSDAYVDGSIDAVHLSANSVDSDAYVDGSIDTAHIGANQVTGAKLNTDAISAQTALAVAPADTDEFMVSDGGVLKRIDYSLIKGINATNFRPNAKPIIINGDFAVAQRTTSTASVSSGANYVADRFAFGPATAGTWTISQEALTADEAFEDGFRTAFKADNTTANGSLSAGSSLQFTQKIEAQDLQLIKYGSSNAEKMTLAFWVKATKTGTNIVEMYQHDCGRSVSVAYTVSSTNTWEHKVVSIPADTGGTINNDNGAGLEIVWWLAAGTNFTSGSLQTSWGSNTATARAVGQVNNADSTSNNFHITGVQLEVGEYTSSTIPPFQHESFGDNMARCQRYYQSNYRDGVYPGANTTNAGTWSGAFYGTDFLTQFTLWQVRMRTNPTITFYTRTGTAGSWYAGVYQVNEAVDTIVSSINTPTGWQATVSGVASNTDVAYGYYVGNAEL